MNTGSVVMYAVIRTGPAIPFTKFRGNDVKASTGSFLVLHVMSAILMFGSLAVAGDGLRMVWYAVAAVLAWPMVGTLRDFIRYYLRDLQQCG